jgi:hypothetical protein
LNHLQECCPGLYSHEGSRWKDQNSYVVSSRRLYFYELVIFCVSSTDVSKL